MSEFEVIMQFINEILDITQNPVQFSLKSLLKYDYEAFEFLQAKFIDIKDDIKTLVTQKRRDLFPDSDVVNINFVPYPKLPLFNQKKCNPTYLNKLFYLRGTVIGLSDPYIIKLFVYMCENDKCSMCKVGQFLSAPIRTCPYCNTKIANPTVLRECFVELVVMDEYNNQVVCRTKNLDDPELNLVLERDNILGKKAEMVVKPFEKFIGKKCIFEVDILGYGQSDFSQLTPKRRVEALKVIKKHKHGLMDMLIREIAPGHYKHDEIKKAILLALVSPVPIHLCFYGDAGIGKSTLVLKFLDFVENSAFITAQTTVAGAVVGIDTGGGENKLILGQLPRANNSVVLVDELNKQNPEIQDSIMHIMSEKKIVYSKIRSFTMDINVSLIFCGNATSPEGRFDPGTPFYSQLNISYPFMSRCHLVVKMDSAGTLENLDEFGKYLLKRKKSDTLYSEQQVQDVINLLRNQKTKKITESAYNSLLEGWKKIVIGVSKSSEDDKANMLTETNRMAGNLKDLALSHSMFHEGNEVTSDDVRSVRNLFQKLHIEPMMKTFGGLNKYRINVMDSDKYRRPMNDDERREAILRTIRSKKEPTDVDKIIKECIGITGVSAGKCEKLVEQLEKKDEISVLQGKVRAKWMTDVEEEEVPDQFDESWLLRQMDLNGGITELQTALEEHISEETFNQLLQKLSEQQKIIVEKDQYKKLG